MISDSVSFESWPPCTAVNSAAGRVVFPLEISVTKLLSLLKWNANELSCHSLSISTITILSVHIYDQIVCTESA